MSRVDDGLPRSAAPVFWGPMAYAIMGGLAVATLLTLVFLPALYVAWFRIKRPESEAVELGTSQALLQGEHVRGTT